MTNRSLGNLLRCLVADHITSWDLALPQAKFAFNNSVNRSTGCTPFEVVYGFRPHTPLDLNPLPSLLRSSEAALDFSSYMKDIYEEVKQRLTLSTESYAASANAKCKDRQFEVGDMVLIRLRPEQFPPGSFTKLHARRTEPFRVKKKLGSNAYVIDLPPDFGISPIFNIEDITEFKGDSTALPTATTPKAPNAPTLRVPPHTTPRDEIASILDHQFVTTHRGGYYKFLVQWKNKPSSNSVWFQASELQRLHPDLFAEYVQHNLSKSSFLGEPAIDANQDA